jgi:hypothetical protein
VRGRGRSRELAVIALYRAQDLVAYRLPQGPADVIALGGDLKRPLLVQVKSTAGGPFEHFAPRDRRDLLVEARRARADALLCWWPPGVGVPVFFAPEQWPKPRTKAIA